MLWSPLWLASLVATSATAFIPTHRSQAHRFANSEPHQCLFAEAPTVSSSLPATQNDHDVPDFSTTGFVLLAGGKGSRMKANMPKQFLPLRGAPILHHSLHLLLEELPTFLATHGQPHVRPHVTLVLDPIYQNTPEYDFLLRDERFKGRVSFANPGSERQDSVENGVATLVEQQKDVAWVAIHDSARPLVTLQEICHVVRDAQAVGAAVLAVPCKATVKESVDGGATVYRTLPRSQLWEVHTPQVIRVDTLQRGFQAMHEKNWQVTDDVSIVEQMGEPVRLTLGEYTNLKITTPEDMNVASAILRERNSPKVRLRRAKGPLGRLAFWKK